MQTIGQRLKQTRESKRLTLEKVFEATRIRLPYLKALEADDHSVMPSPVQARGYLRNYAEFLGLDFDQLLEELRSQNTPSDVIITPMDVTVQTAAQPEEVLPPQEETPPPVEPFDQPQGKPARRKKADSQTQADPVPPREFPENPEDEPATVSTAQEIEPEQAAEQSLAGQAQDVNENLWQTWLNRLSSVISVRANRKEEVQSEVAKPQVVAEGNEIPPILVDELISSKIGQVQSSVEIFKEIGGELRNRREMLSLHLEEVERNTKVKAHYLDALEMGAMDKLPSTVQTRGMLSNYASFLDLDVDAILLRYADALQTRHRERNPQRPVRQFGEVFSANIPPLRNFIAGDMVFGIGIAILLVGFLVWGINRVVMLQSQDDIQPTAPSISDILLSTPDSSLFTPTATLALIEDDEPTVTIVIPTQNLNVNVQINLVAIERTYLRVIVDGEEVFNGRVSPGNAYPFEAEEQVEVLVGSGAAIRVVYNGRDLGLLGGFGQVVSNIYREEEIVTPTALPTSVPTNTFTPTATLRASQTPLPSATPRTTGTP